MTKKPKLTHGPYVLLLVEWQDAIVDNGWTSTDTEPLVPAIIKSIGWKLSDTEKALILASDIGDQFDPVTRATLTETNRRIAIPKDWVISIKELK